MGWWEKLFGARPAPAKVPSSPDDDDREERYPPPGWPNWVRDAFQSGTRIDDAVMEVHPIGSLSCPTGQIVAADPLVGGCDTPPFAQEVAPGTYPVVLSVARYDDDARVAFAMLRLSEAWPDRWSPALLAGQDPASLRPGEAYGYPVDAGLGCFFDAKAQPLLNARMEALDEGQDYYSDVVASELDAHADPRGTWSWAMHRPAPDDPTNIAIFSSGVGDGVYPSFWGWHGDQLVCLITDFQILHA